MNRFDCHQYSITASDYNKIMELVNFYHESMYLLPDFETIEVTEEPEHITKKMRINELVFV
ncbi:MAG: hypothetical protein JXQ90_04290 [Cyclobacteriaceae bacterium]